MPRETLPITPSVLKWARERSGYSIEELQAAFGAIEAWEEGAAEPTYPQLEQLAQRLNLPVAAFFFPEPPKTESIRESFRTLPDAEFDQIPRQVKAALRKAKAMQLNLRELNDERNPQSNLIIRDLSFSASTDVEDMAERVRDYLGVPLDMQTRWSDAETALEEWRTRVAACGVFVFKDAFRSDEYSGFCLFDDEFPLIYINNSTSKTRQIFTLFHELAHLLFHTSGIDTISGDYVDDLPVNSRTIEIACNRFAAEILVPKQAFDDVFRARGASRESASVIARLFHVSREVIYRKFLDRGAVAQGEYDAAVGDWRAQNSGRPGGGGDYYNTQMSYLGKDYIRLAFRRYYQERISDVQLAEYLNISPKNLSTFEARFARRPV